MKKKIFLIKISLIFSIFTFSQDKTSELDSLEYLKISEMSLDKVKELTRYISIIGGKTTKRELANQMINAAVELFINEDCLMGVSSLRKPDSIIYYPIRKYFNRLKMLKYNRVVIKSAEVKYESNLIRMPDNSYGGAVAFFQTFIAYNGDEISYTDKTIKVSEIKVKAEQQIINGENVPYWDIFLGDIRVKETK